MKKTDDTRAPSRADELTDRDIDRRSFLGRLGGISLGTAGGLILADSACIEEDEDLEASPRSPSERADQAYRIRHRAALRERHHGIIEHVTNGDEDRYPSFIGNFHKSMPHDALGEVDPDAYEALLHALHSGELSDFEAIPAVGTAPLINPMGGLAYSLVGPDSAAVPVNPPPPLASAELAAQAAELYWMALLRDVPFAHYDTDPRVAQAASDLTRFSGYTGPRAPSGEVTPQVLFRLPYPGVLDGPIVSQFLLAEFSYDGIPIVPRISTAAPGIDFLTDFDEWLEAQNGFPGGAPGPDPRDPVLRYPRSARDLGSVAWRDVVYSQYFKAALILVDRFGVAKTAVDAANPYRSSVRQVGLSTFGVAHLLYLVGEVTQAARHTWYQKWNVHRFLRPEAYGGLVHNHLVGSADYPIHADLLASPVLQQIFEYNRQQNQMRLGKSEGSFLLPQMPSYGAPVHPSFPAGHAYLAGACVTVLKACVDEDIEFPDPVKPSADGLSLEPYVAGVDGPPLTLGGELNKLAHNLSTGRDMSGVHWRVDGVEGNRQGEEVAIHILREERATYPEPFRGFSLTRFDGTTITV